MYAGMPLKTILKSFATACEDAAIEGVTPHTLKQWGLRFGATEWDMAGLTATSTETIERVYGHYVASDLQEKTNRIVWHAQQTRNGLLTPDVAGE
jgi:hypothetical protein